MPIYEYKCESCSAVLEKLQKISDAPLRECPECGKPTLVRLVSAPSFRLKGSGWYETDFKTGNNKKHGTASEGAAASDSVKTEAAATPAPAAGSKPAASSAD
ncbi:MAG TPA: zinc ribbon domain-containing protein [Hyphomicrobiales bacterium]|nr:zinc ribbon domain-containing protein [Hyphomicrobiales bacterium]